MDCTCHCQLTFSSMIRCRSARICHGSRLASNLHTFAASSMHCSDVSRTRQFQRPAVAKLSDCAGDAVSGSDAAVALHRNLQHFPISGKELVNGPRVICQLSAGVHRRKQWNQTKFIRQGRRSVRIGTGTLLLQAQAHGQMRQHFAIRDRRALYRIVGPRFEKRLRLRG